MSSRSVPDRATLCAELVQIIVSRTFRVPLARLCASTRDGPEIAFARQVAMYLTHTFFGVSFTRTGATFGRERTTVAYACRVIEEAREDKAIDHAIEHAIALLRILRRVDATAHHKSRPAQGKEARHAQTIGA